MKINLIKTTDHDIHYIEQSEGNVLICKDSNKIYYDNKNNIRLNITLQSLILDTEKEKENILNPLINKVYIVNETSKIYSYDGYRWSQIENGAQLQHTLQTTLDEFVSGVVYDNGNLYAPKTTASSVYMNDGSRLSANINSSRILSVTKTKPIYVQATEDNQRVFEIPFPITNYDFKENHMSVITKGDLLNTESYIVNNDRLILNRSIKGLNKGEAILFIFYYTEHIDLNEKVILHTDNYANGSITSEKLSNNIRISAYNIVETIDRIFFTKEEKEKLKGVEENATCYHHPETHPAIMIVQDSLHRFVTDEKIKLWNAKADGDKVYTKDEVDAMFKNLIGDAPEMLNTLEELAKALDNDENHAVTFTKQLATKAEKKELEALGRIVEKKVNIDDYVRSPIYGTPALQNKLQCSYYHLNVDDPNFKQYIDGMQVILKIDNPNIGDTYLSINGLPAQHVVTVEGYDLIENELIQHSLYTLRYNGTTGNFILQGKGGVKVRNTSLESYFVEKGQSIIRGDIVDINNNNKAIHSVPRVRVISNLETDEEKYNSESNIELYKIDDNRFIVFWKFKKFFQAQVFALTDGFIDISPLTLKRPIIINNDCIEFKVDTMENGNYILSYADTKNKVTTQIVQVTKDSTILLLEPYVKDEKELIANINIIYTQNDRAIVGWEYGNKTRCMLISTENNEIGIISGRDNIEYPLDSYCFIDPTQILFCASKGKEIKGWIMNISDNDFSNASLCDIVTSKSVDFNTPVLSKIGKRKVLSEWTDITGEKFYRQYIDIDYKGKILFSEPYTIDTEEYRVKSDKKPKYKNISDTFFIAPSNMNYKMPSTKGGEGDKCIKFTISNINNNTYKEVESHCSIRGVTADNLSYDIINRDTLVLVYNTKINKTDETHLYFSVAKFRKIPYGIAISCANENELVSIARW